MGILLKMVVNGVFAILSGGFVHYLYFQSGEIIDSTSFFAWCLESLIQIWVHFHVKKKLCFFGWHLLFLWGINLSTPCHHPAPQSAAQQASSRVVGNFHLLTKKTAGFWCIFSSVKKKGGHKKASPHSTLEKPLEEWIQKKMRLIDIIESIVFFVFYWGLVANVLYISKRGTGPLQPASFEKVATQINLDEFQMFLSMANCKFSTESLRSFPSQPSRPAENNHFV